jgi:mono/diheme cytochrome c family protein
VLSGVRLTTPDAEKAFRQKVLDGGFRMPAFRYGLTSPQIDDLVAYFKAIS